MGIMWILEPMILFISRIHSTCTRGAGLGLMSMLTILGSRNLFIKGTKTRIYIWLLVVVKKLRLFMRARRIIFLLLMKRLKFLRRRPLSGLL